MDRSTSSLTRAAARVTAAFAAALAAAALGSPARGDVVGPPPVDCPEGSTGGSSHCGEYCAARRCTDDDDCEGDRTCEETELCLTVLECMSSGGPFTQEAVTDTCEGGGACASGVCQTARVCVPPESDTSAQRYGCTCAVADRDAAVGSALLGLVAAAVVLRLRRRRGSSTK